MYIYRDCQGGGALFDSAPGAPYQASVTVYLQGQSNPVFNFSLGPPLIEPVDPNPGNPCLIVPSNVCVQRAVYNFPVVDLPVSNQSYYIVYQRCCRNVTINNILPGKFDTDRIRGSIRFSAQKAGVSEAQQAEKTANEVPAKRLGTPEEFGMACAFLCSAHAGYITGRNLILDGGLYPGAF